ncbi:MAG TPA: hypothetical protein VFT56_10050 [Sphingomonas sp.]|nr:hypothetical protein [Sphingomonas sp.]
MTAHRADDDPVNEGVPSAPRAALVDSIVGNAPLNKRPLLIADELEEQFLRDGWPEGMSLGGEVELANRYGVGRDVLREVVRLLEARNHARMRRGPRGGLEVVRPDLDDLTARLTGYAYVSGLDRSAVVDAWVTLQAAAVRLLDMHPGQDWPILVSRLHSKGDGGVRAFGDGLIEASGSPLLIILGQMIAGLLPGSLDGPLPASAFDQPSGAPDARSLLALLRGTAQSTLMRLLDLNPAERAITSPVAPRSRCFQHQAMHLVHELMTEISPVEWARGHLIGNEFDLSDRLGVDKSVMRQAIRLMEDAETATSLPGRGRGLMTRLPSTAPLSRLLCALLAAHGVDDDDGEQVFEALRIESAGLAAERASSEDRATLLAMSNDLDELVAPLPVAALQGFERLQQHVAHNRLLGLCVDGVKAFLTWRSEAWPVASAAIVETYRKHTQCVVAAMCAGDSAAAMSAEAAKLAALNVTREHQVRPALQERPVRGRAMSGKTGHGDARLPH